MNKINLQATINAWARGSTMAHIARRKDLIRDKARSVADFFDFVGLDFDQFQPDQLNQIKPEHVKAWQLKLESEGLTGGKGSLSLRSVYGAMSKVSSFYKWTIEKGVIESNPVLGQLPKLPKTYDSDTVKKSLSMGQVTRLLATMLEKTQSKTDRLRIQGWRDLAITLHLLLTGRRRAEVLGLTWGDFDFDRKPIRCTYRIKGGEVKTWDIQTPLIEAIMRRYLAEAGRLDSMVPNSPIWISLRDSPRSKAGSPLTASAYAKTLKVYARKAGIPKIRVHRIRYTFAHFSGKASHSYFLVKEALGYSSEEAAKHYSGDIGLFQGDPLSKQVVKNLELEDLMKYQLAQANHFHIYTITWHACALFLNRCEKCRNTLEDIEFTS